MAFKCLNLKGQMVLTVTQLITELFKWRETITICLYFPETKSIRVKTRNNFSLNLNTFCN